jgi:hypothetical protein
MLGEQSLTGRTRQINLSITSSCRLLSCGTALKKALQVKLGFTNSAGNKTSHTGHGERKYSDNP